MTRLLATVALLATITTATAQSPLPKTTTFHDPDGNTIGTATTWGLTTVLRDANGELTGSITIEANGTKTFRDPHGKVTQTATTTKEGVTTLRNSEGQIIGTTTEEKDGRLTRRDASGQVTGSSKLGDQSQSISPAR